MYKLLEKQHGNYVYIPIKKKKKLQIISLSYCHICSSVGQKKRKLHSKFFIWRKSLEVIWILPLKKPTALSGCAHRKQPHWKTSASSWSAEPPTLPGHNWNTSKNPECLNSFRSVSWSLEHGNALVTTVKKVLFSHLSISQQCFKLVTLGSLELRACGDFAFNN